MWADEADFPDQKTVRIGGVTVHVIHGHQVVPWGDPAALLSLSRSLDADLLIHGHTHTTQVWYDKNTQRMLLNPGSTTGAYSPFNTSLNTPHTRIAPHNCASTKAQGICCSWLLIRSVCFVLCCWYSNVVPSFLVLSIRGKSCTVYCYEARGGEVRVTKADYTSPR